MAFEKSYLKYLEFHRNLRSGERRRRLAKGLGHGEKLFLQTLWWKGFGHFDHLHPEYEVTDERGRSRFIDFAFVFSWFRIAIEILGYNPHSKQADRWKFTDEQQRIRTLSSSGWVLMYFSIDEITDHPEQCLLEIQSLLGRLIGKEQGKAGLELGPLEKEIIRLAVSHGGVLRARDVYGGINIHRNTAYRYLKGLVKQGWLETRGSVNRTTEYKLNEHKKHLL